MPKNPMCKLCPLSQTARSVCVWGEGPSGEEVMWVGRNPGGEEDARGRPFVGPAGKLLREAATRAGLPVEQGYITNLVKCYTPQNGVPDVTTIKACDRYLREELTTVKPKYVIAMGNEALKWFTGRSGITAATGKEVWSEDWNCWLLPIFHPSYLLQSHDPKLRTQFDATLNRYVGFIHNSGILAEHQQPVVQLCQTKEDVSEAFRALATCEVIAYDLETTGLDAWAEGAKVLTVQLAGSPDKAWVLPVDHPQAEIRVRLSEVAELLRNKKTVAHNCIFDMGWFTKEEISVSTTFDTMLAAHMHDEHGPKDLKSLVVSELNGPNYGIDLSNAESVPLPVLAEYGGLDAAYTFQLREQQLRRMVKPENAQTVRIFRYLTMPSLHRLADIERFGIMVDWNYVDNLERQKRERLAELEDNLNAYMPGRGWNWASDAHVGTLLFDRLGLPVYSRTTSRDRASTKEEDLLNIHYDTGHPVLPLVLEHRNITRTLEFLTIWRELSDRDGRLHAHYNLAGTKIFRTSCSRPNLQAVTRGYELRRCFVPRSGWTMVSADLSQIDLRIIAIESGDPLMNQTLKERGGDLHTTTAAKVMQVASEQVNSEQRRAGKAVNFGYDYGMSSKRFAHYAFTQYGMRISESEAEEFRRVYFQTYQLESWHRRRIAEAHRSGGVLSLLGRFHHLPNIHSTDWSLRSESERCAINYPVQSVSNDILFGGFVQTQLDYNQIIPVGLIHDALLFEVRTDVLSRWTNRIRQCLETVNNFLKERLLIDLNFPIYCDIEIGPSWGETEKVNALVA